MSRRVHLTIGLAALVCGGTFAALAFARYATFHNETFDLAFYARIAWGLVHFDAYDPIVGGLILGLHLSFIMLPLGLFGAVFGQVPVLIVVQSGAIAAAAWPFARMGHRRWGELGAIVCAAAWLLYPNLGHVGGFEFHPGTVAVLPLAWAAEAMDRGDRRALVWSVIGTLACREDLALVTAIAGWIALRRAGSDEPMRRDARRIIVWSLAYFAVFAFVLHPIFAPPRGSMQLHFGKWGHSAVGVATYLVTHPMALVEHLGAPERLGYLPKILAPLALLPLLRPMWLLPALPVVAITLLSDFPKTTDLDSHYLTPALPWIVAAAIHGAGALDSWLERLGRARRPIVLLLLAAPAVAAHLVAGGTPIARDFRAADFREDAHTRAAREILALIPDGASVQAPDSLLAHLAERRYVHRAPPPERLTRYMVLDVRHRLRFVHDEDLLRTAEEPEIRRWMGRGDHRVIAAEHDLILLKRGASPRRGLGGRVLHGTAPPESGVAITRCLAVRGARIAGSRLELDLVVRDRCPNDMAIRLGTGKKPRRVDLLFGGLLSPWHLRRGDHAISVHDLDASERAAILREGLRVGALRSSGARVDPPDPTAIDVQVTSM